MGERIDLTGRRFGKLVVVEYDHSNAYNASYWRCICYYTGTSGWNVALWSTCKRLGLMDFYKWYDGLRWFESDEFDSVLSDELVKKIEDSEAGVKNVYYMWLFNEKEGNNEESETE